MQAETNRGEAAALQGRIRELEEAEEAAGRRAAEAEERVAGVQVGGLPSFARLQSSCKRWASSA